uniref:NADH-ubiquinone oxidoreductase chain 4 n=1 Tax=Carios vespertilionis TaxID=870211 RepID=A0A8B0R7G7_9ACAR|nr:NADH dehydrogenase subunit 4 [Carios vespertilionis]QTW91419.1 NADH dehydrogenase subunit 4 [Carios vespertilionis]QTW91432.1 NADH dehydrogenase subunit 4 [Carios vespertilionis]
MLILFLGLLLLFCICLVSGIEIMFVIFFMSIMMFLIIDWSSLVCLVGESLMMDLLSFLLIELSLWMIMLMFLASMNLKVFNGKLYNWYILFMLMMLCLCFSISNLLGFYLFFESVLFPIIMLIFGWGNQPERLQAGIYMLFYTLFGSLPLLLFLLMNNFYLSFLFMSWIDFSSNFFLMMMSSFAFLVKLPMFLVHMWLPKAHVEAPIVGSMILAGVLLKLGIYGMFRLLFMIIDSVIVHGCWMISILVLGSVMICLICLCQVDMKALIAYSSVSHMGLAMAGLLSLHVWGFYGNLLIMLGHGLCSSGLFCLANFYYERFKTRSMIMLSGMGIFFPFLSIWWFFFCVINMAAPPTMNLGGELLLMGALIKWSSFLVIPLGVISFLSAGYSLYLFSYTQHGKGWIYYSVYLISVRESLLMFLHLIPLVCWCLKMELFCKWL